ncbi:MAG: DUF2203 family protein [Gemmatimonadetes bacterium]|nr:DUF2203 family protein [Gemmatimonadota bacterium]
MAVDGVWWGSRTWTPAEATAALPLVRRIADDLGESYTRWRAAVEAFEYATSGAKADAPSPDADRLMAEAQALAAQIDDLQGELTSLDIRVARLEHTLIAFRSEKDGVIVPLFWAPRSVAPSYDWPDSVPAYGMSTSWPSRAPIVSGNRSRA